MKILRITADNRRKTFVVETRKGIYAFPYAKLQLPPSPADRLVEVHLDEDLGREACSPSSTRSTARWTWWSETGRRAFLPEEVFSTDEVPAPSVVTAASAGRDSRASFGVCSSTAC